MRRLPEEVVTSILTRLPVKKLLQFKCVCKLWNSTISDPQFAKLQLQQSQANNNNNGNNSRIVVFLFNLQTICLDYENNDDRFAESQLDFPLSYSQIIQVFGYCHGLFGVEFGSEAVIWNPAIRQYRILPNSNNSLSVSYKSYVGFGYDSVLDDYKVVRSFEGASGQMMLEVFALKTNQWRTIGETYSRFISHHQSSNFLNGSLHWFDASDFPDKTTFVAFNLTSEKLLEVPLPNANGVKFSRMVILDGCLCVYRVDNDDCGIEIWVMKEYMVGASWTKLGTLLFQTIPRKKFLRPLCYSRNGDILLEIAGKHVVKYDMNEKCCRAVFNMKCYNFFDLKYYTIIEALAYVESMISLNYDDGVRRIV